MWCDKCARRNLNIPSVWPRIAPNILTQMRSYTKPDWLIPFLDKVQTKTLLEIGDDYLDDYVLNHPYRERPLLHAGILIEAARNNPHRLLNLLDKFDIVVNFGYLLSKIGCRLMREVLRADHNKRVKIYMIKDVMKHFKNIPELMYFMDLNCARNRVYKGLKWSAFAPDIASIAFKLYPELLYRDYDRWRKYKQASTIRRKALSEMAMVLLMHDLLNSWIVMEIIINLRSQM